MARITFIDTEIDDICAYRSTLTYLDDEKLSLITFFLIVNSSRKYWFIKLDDALWAYRIAYKTPIGMSPYKIVFGKPCHLPLELEYKSMWAIRKLNCDFQAAKEKRVLQMNELEE